MSDAIHPASVVRRALISASNKHGLVDFARQLSTAQCEIIATGKTAQLLLQHKISVTEVSKYTDFPEILGGRVKTLHPKIHGGILGRPDQDAEQMKAFAIPPINIVVANLYPFQETVAKKNTSLEEAIEQIDIGGVTLIRAAAKNHRYVTVLVDPNDYDVVMQEINKYGNTREKTRLQLAEKAFAYTAQYDAAISQYFSKNSFPQRLHGTLVKQTDLRYGENPHQKAACYVDTNAHVGLAQAKFIQGKELSFNNLMDGDAALRCVQSFDKPACAIIKHATPCGIAVANHLIDAYEKAYACDPVSAFGGIIAFNHTLDAKTTQKILAQQFVEVIIAPQIEPEAQKLIATKPNIRLLQCDMTHQPNDAWTYHSITGGLLLQTVDNPVETINNWNIVTRRKPNDKEIQDLDFAWRVAKFVKSNAIVFAKDGATLAIGSGQTSRVFSAKIAVLKAAEAKLSLQNSVVASDGFFPFADGIEMVAAAGAIAVIQPGGSMRDQEIIAKADELGLAMVFTGIRHFRH